MSDSDAEFEKFLQQVSQISLMQAILIAKYRDLLGIHGYLINFFIILQSLSSSGASYLSELSRSGVLRSGQQQSVKLFSRI